MMGNQRRGLELVEIPEKGTVASEYEVELPLLAKEMCTSNQTLYARQGLLSPWTGYLVREGDSWVGTCGFKSAPVNGKVEIAYFTFPEFEGRGIGTAMAEALVAKARTHDPGLIVTAQTLPKPNASNRILQKIGFRFVGSVETLEDGTVWEWHLVRDAREPRAAP